MADEQELIREVLDTFNRSGSGSVIELLKEKDALAPGFLVRLQPDYPNGGDWPGEEGYTKMMLSWLEVWESFSVELQGIEPAGESRWICPVIAGARSASGAEVEAAFVYTFVFEDGRLARLGIWADQALAREDLDAG